MTSYLKLLIIFNFVFGLLLFSFNPISIYLTPYQFINEYSPSSNSFVKLKGGINRSQGYFGSRFASGSRSGRGGPTNTDGSQGQNANENDGTTSQNNQGHGSRDYSSPGSVNSQAGAAGRSGSPGDESDGTPPHFPTQSSHLVSNSKYFSTSCTCRGGNVAILGLSSSGELQCRCCGNECYHGPYAPPQSTGRSTPHPSTGRSTPHPSTGRKTPPPTKPKPSPNYLKRPCPLSHGSDRSLKLDPSGCLVCSYCDNTLPHAGVDPPRPSSGRGYYGRGFPGGSGGEYPLPSTGRRTPHPSTGRRTPPPSTGRKTPPPTKPKPSPNYLKRPCPLSHGSDRSLKLGPSGCLVCSYCDNTLPHAGVDPPRPCS